MNTLLLVLGQTMKQACQMKQAYSGIQKNILFFELAKTKQTDFLLKCLLFRFVHALSFSVCACFKLALMSKL
jgi:hypothetical protein